MELLGKAAALVLQECAAGSACEAGMRRAVRSLDDAAKLVTTVPTQRLDDESMLRFLQSLVLRISQTKEGETLLVPVNLAHAEAEAEAVLLAVQRRSTSPGRFSFAVIAGGASLAYHALSVGATTAAFEHHAALVLEHVPEARLADGAFWYLLFRAQLTNTALGMKAAPATEWEAAAAAAKSAAKATQKAASKVTKVAVSVAKEKLKELKHRLIDHEEDKGAEAAEAEREEAEVPLIAADCR